MKRVITSFKNANKDLLNYITAEYPDGVDDEALINFPKVGGGSVRALEIIMDDINYLVKMENEEYFQKYLAREDEDEEDEEDLNDGLDQDEVDHDYDDSDDDYEADDM